MKGLVVAANRLPVEISVDGHLSPSPGGLASALSSVTAPGTQWVGWAGPDAAKPKPFDHGELRLHPVALSPDDVDRYYRGFSNAVLWPLFHGRLRRVELKRAWWNSYRVVNRRFANAVTHIAPLGGTVWVHDYHLLLAPAMIREKRPDLRIGLFLHIPFPNAQLFAMLPWRREVIEGMLGADVVGFQVPDDVANFVAAAERLVEPRILGHTVLDGSRAVDVDAFPISIDFARWDELGEGATAQAQENRRELGVESVLLGIDRLDYTKGIAERLRAFGELLDQGSLDTERCAFVQVAVPSRSDVAAYEDERDEVEQLIDRINVKHRRRNGSVPVRYIDYSLDEVGMAAWFRAADALVVTSLADGMNLVAKEFVAARGDLDGALILSEFAGAAHDLDGALIVNPYDIEDIKQALLMAIEMAPAERAARLRTMRAAVRHNDVHRWARTFLTRLELSGSVRTDDLVLRPGGGEIATRRDLANRRGLHSKLVETIPS
ncbi:MAG: alpha,alpha-trehalose-phosphate synthase (UDP-forming) [Ilumatobacteraceae bacterium]